MGSGSHEAHTGKILSQEVSFVQLSGAEESKRRQDWGCEPRGGTSDYFSIGPYSLFDLEIVSLAIFSFYALIGLYNECVAWATVDP